MRFQGQIRGAFLLLSDAVVVCAAWGAVVWGYWAIGIGHYEPEFYLRMWPVVPAFLLTNALFRLYHGNLFYPAAPLSPVEEMRRLIGSALITHFGAITFLALSRQTTVDYSRFVMVVAGLAVAFLAQPFRDVVRSVMYRFGIGQIPAVLIGSGRAAERAMSALSDNAYVGLRLVGFFDREGRSLGKLKRLGDLRAVVDVARRIGVRVLVACEDERIFRSQLSEYTKFFTHIEYLPSATVFPIFGSQTISLDGMGGVEMVNQGRMPLLRVEKWILDRTLSLLAFVLLSPLFVVISLAVRMTSPGPAFFRHRRLGRNGKPIRIWKFRTMYADAEARLESLLASDPALKAEFEANFKLKRDPRVTPFGKFLRKTSLDEIPQLFNVLTGEMALVGPRPIVEKEVAYYGESYGVFSSVKPGITGLWQATGRSETDYDRRVALDVQYVLNWSPWLDIWILIRTVFAVFFMRGAC